MGNYTTRFTLTVSSTVVDTAAKIGKGLDPDSGGEYSFTDNGNGTLTTDTPCTLEFKTQANYLKTDANALHQAVLADYATRWPDLIPPTLAECQAFLAAIIK